MKKIQKKKMIKIPKLIQMLQKKDQKQTLELDL